MRLRPPEERALFLSTPSARRATGGCSSSLSSTTFLSTPSARRATAVDFGGGKVKCDFYPRPPRGGRPHQCDLPPPVGDFYPRPPRGGRHAMIWQEWFRDQFLSTPSARRATTQQHQTWSIFSNFYPRPPRGGRLLCMPCACWLCPNFYPRPPRGGRPSKSKTSGTTM